MHPSLQPLPEVQREALVSDLNKLVACMADLSSQAKHAHLNVKGPGFISVHRLLDELYETAAEYTDTLAERAISLGGHVYATVRSAASASELPELPLETTDEQTLIVLISMRIAQMSKLLYEAMIVTHIDMVTQDVYVEQARGLDKYLYFFQSHIPVEVERIEEASEEAKSMEVQAPLES